MAHQLPNIISISPLGLAIVAATSTLVLCGCPVSHAFETSHSLAGRSARNGRGLAMPLDGMKIGDAEGWLNDDDANQDRTENVTKQDFLKEMLQGDTTVRRKKNGRNGYKGYKVMDNRDALPFVVQVATPDPYTPGDKMKSEARKNSKRDLEKKEHKLSKKNKANTSRHNLVGMDGVKDGIASSINVREKDGSLHKVLGQYTLDKSTNCGDLIEITVGDECREFEVMRTRCQYKYAGGKRFVMVRKILEVKERTRIAQETHLMKSLEIPHNDDEVPEAERL